jgi:DNA-binding response OmpR family regulator
MVKPMIAVVDDDAAMCQLLETLLSEVDYAVQSWPSGIAAFDHLVRHPPALIILDLALGNDPEAGWEILTLLRAERQTARIPVILLSANGEFLHRREHILRTKKHATSLAKPFEVDALLILIEQALSLTLAG